MCIRDRTCPQRSLAGATGPGPTVPRACVRRGPDRRPSLVRGAERPQPRLAPPGIEIDGLAAWPGNAARQGVKGVDSCPPLVA
eukprot:3917674-Alexandrium_andersonii.AAC.1